MKRLFAKIFFVLCCGGSSLHALYNGNPSFPMMPEDGMILSREAWMGLKLGYEWDDIFDRKLRVHGHHEGLKGQISEYAAMGNFGVITLGFNDRVELYGTLGAMTAHIHQNPTSGNRIKYTTHDDFAWDVGGRAILAYWGDTQLGVDAKYFQFSPSFSSMERNGHSLDTEGAKMHYTEWQVGMGVSHRIKMLIPYLGVKYSYVWSKLSHLNAIDFLYPSKHFIMRNQIPFGLFLGCGISPDRIINLNFEVQLIDETAVTVSGDLRF